MNRVNTWLVVMMIVVMVELIKMIQDRLSRSWVWESELMYL